MKTNPSEKSEQQFRKMTRTPVNRLVFAMSVPTVISMMVSNIYNLADTYFVSSIGTSASGAVGIVFALMAIVSTFGLPLLLAQCLKSKYLKKVRKLSEDKED